MINAVHETIHHDNQQLALTHYRHQNATWSILLLPAMGVPASYYHRFATALHSHSYDVTIADLRGTGNSTPLPTRTMNYGYAELITDIAAIFDHLSQQLAGKQVLLLGHSLGGHIASLYLGGLHRAKEPPPVTVDAFATIACGIPHYRLYGPKGPVLRQLVNGITASSRLIGHWPGHLFGGRQARGVIQDWAHTVRHGRFVDIAGHDSQTDLATIKLPIHTITVANDTLTPPPTNTLLTSYFTGTNPTTFHYTGTPETTPINHFRWALSAEPIINQLENFLNSH